MRAALIVLCALSLDASLADRARAAQVCAWIVESVEDDGAHKFELNLGVDAPTSLAVRFQGPPFISVSMGGDMIQLEPGEANNVEGDGFAVLAGVDLRFNVQLFDRPITFEEMEKPTRKPLATFDFHRKVGEDERTPPADLAAKQCKTVG